MRSVTRTKECAEVRSGHKKITTDAWKKKKKKLGSGFGIFLCICTILSYSSPVQSKYHGEDSSSEEIWGLNKHNNSDVGLSPPVFNLARHAAITANGTCGEEGDETYCKIVEHVHNRPPRPSQCQVCSADSPDKSKRHPIRYAIDESNRWWQSPTLANGRQYEWITITIDLKRVYQVAYLIIKAAISPRPGNWILERSKDGIDFLPWQYFAMSDDECWNRYGITGKAGRPTYIDDDEVICTSYFSRITPFEGGEIHVSLLNGRPGAEMLSEKLTKFTMARYIRLRLQKIRTLHGDLLTMGSGGRSWDTSVLRRYFYSIKDIAIGGTCVCFGHASQCVTHEDGSPTAKCMCQHNTCGDNCDVCCPLFNQYQWGPGNSSDSGACEECQCYGHADACTYDPHVHEKRLSINTHGAYDGGGICLNCKAHTAGYNCEKCQEGYYRPKGVPVDDPEPCIKCNCSSLGSVGYCVPSEIEAETLRKNPGDCICKEGFGGKHCDQCLKGYKAFPNCAPCPCNLAGILNQNCEEDMCVCKENVEGTVCNACKKGYFNLDEGNPEGCTQCFCHGVATECTSSNFPVATIQNVTKWHVTDLHGTKTVPAVELTDGQLASNEDFAAFDQYFWTANEAFAGKQIFSYGLQLEYTASWVQARGDTSGRFIQDYDFIIQSSSSMLAFGLNTYDGENATITATLTERECIVLPDVDNNVIQSSHQQPHGRPCNRYDIMECLSDVKRILFRAKFHTDQIEAVLIGATFQTAEPGARVIPGNQVASSVEICTCPPGYTGTSCEFCDFGYRKSSKDSWLNECVKCDCNGHSECDVEGNCLKCEHNTTGKHCETCVEGCHGDPTSGNPLACKPCECPLGIPSNNFSPTCRTQEDSYVCTACPEGYTGPYCERCDTGYFGNPTDPGQTCKPCQCRTSLVVNGTMVNNCDHLTGECLSCPPNTVGWNCDQCGPHHFGDPQAGTCQPCNCEAAGSLSLDCNQVTGDCSCKSGFEGKKCSTCLEGHGGPQEGCPTCDCNPIGSTSLLCDRATGQCPCKDGIGGRYCNKCTDLHYGFGPQGCSACSCHPQGSDSTTCDLKTGECHCLPFVEGRSCDQCRDGYWNLESGTGCQRCDCDPLGSMSYVCHSETGQCQCRTGIGGQKCDNCLPGFYGYSPAGCRECDPCEKPGHVCDERDGRCRCPPNTEGDRCEKCEIGFWGHSASGCKECNCSLQGSMSPQCSPETGKCSCLEGFDGPKCDTCKFGHYNYPTCTPCDCDPEGTVASYCDETGKCSCGPLGKCHCKVNVEGKRCDRCKDGTYGLSAADPEGCMRCFCFQRTSRCSEGYFKWTRLALPSERNIQIRPGQVESQLRGVNNLIVIPDQSETIYIESDISFGAPLYWQLPHIFLGDKVLSYNGFLRFHLSSVSTSSPFPPPVLASYPLVQIQGNHKLILEHYPGDSSVHNGFHEIKLHEDSWVQKNGSDIQPVDKEFMMVALQNLQHIFIRATNAPEVFNVTFYNVSLDIATPSNDEATSLAHGIEVCECPPEYNSTSCQNPKLGYYRWYKREYIKSTVIIDLVGEARPCECNGRSDYCDTENGHCLNCSGNTAGRHCEVCAPGFHGDPLRGCLPCPCPSIWNNNAETCYPNTADETFTCLCKQGYTGPQCDRCDYSFYGNPWEPDGQCSPCNCNPYGSVSDECNEITGQCSCRQGVTGRDCSMCADRHVIIAQRCVSCEDQCTGTLFIDVDRIGSQLRNITINPIVAAIWKRLLTLELHSKEMVPKVADLTAVDLIVNYLPTHTTLARLLALRIDEMKELSLNGYMVSMPTFMDRSAGLDDRIQDIGNEVNETLSGLKRFLNATLGETGVNAAIIEARQILFQLQGLSFDEIENEVEAEAEDVQHIFDSVQATVYDLTAAIAMELKLDILGGKLEDLLIYLGRVHENAEKSNLTVVQGNELFEKVQKKIDSIDDAVTDLEVKAITSAEKSVEAEAFLLEAEQVASSLEDFIQTFEKLLGDLDERERMLIEQIPLAELQTAQPAFQHVKMLEGQARQMQRFLESVNFSEPLNAVTAYTRITEGFDEAEEVAIGASFDSVDAAEKIREMVHRNPLMAMIETTAQEIQNTLASLDTRKIGMRRELDELMSDLEVLKWEIRVGNETIRGIFNVMEEYEEILRLEEITQKLEDAMDIASAAYEEAVVTDADIRNELKVKLMTIAGGTGGPVDVIDTQRRVDQLPYHVEDIKSSTSQLLAEKVMLEAKEDDLDDKLRRLRALVAKASHKSEAMKVAIGPDDTGTCFRLYKWPIIEDTTSVQFRFAPTKTADSLLFYWPSSINDDFIAVEMSEEKIKVSWDLGSGLRTLIHPKQIEHMGGTNDSPAGWVLISVDRVGSTVTVDVKNVNDASEENTKIVHHDPEEHHTLLNLASTDLIHIGGMSKQTRPGLVPNGLSGCIHQLIVNDRPLGLWNFVGNEGCAPCMECLQDAEKYISTELDYYLDGRGYVLLQRSETTIFNPQLFELELEFKTFSETALLFLTVDESSGQMISIELKEGYVGMQVRHGWTDLGDSLTIQARDEKHNVGEWVKLRAVWVSQRGTQTGQLTIGGKSFKEESQTPGIELQQYNTTYQVGGLAPDYNTRKYRRMVSSTSFVGCIKNVFIDNLAYDLMAGYSHGIEPSCRGKASYVASYEGDGYGEYLAEPMGKEFVMGFSFKTLYPSGILAISTFAKKLQMSTSPEPYYAIYLENGKIRMQFGVPQGPLDLTNGDERYDDGKFHSFRLVKKNRRMIIYVDDEEIEEARLPKKSPVVPAPSKGGLFVGGLREDVRGAFQKSSLKMMRDYAGCIQNFYFGKELIDFSMPVSVKNQNLAQCPTYYDYEMTSVPTEFLYPAAISASEGIRYERLYAEHSCASSKTVIEKEDPDTSLHFGDSRESYASITLEGHKALRHNFNVTFQFRTFDANGVLFLAGKRKGNSDQCLAAYLHQGQVYVQMETDRSIQMRTPLENLNDGQWHSVTIVKTEEKMFVYVDFHNVSISKTVRLKTMTRLYLGGVHPGSSDCFQEVVEKAGVFKGCIRNLNVNSNLINFASKSVAVHEATSCFREVQPGAYFSPGGYAIYSAEMTLDDIAEVELEFKSETKNGLLLKFQGEGPGSYPQFSIYLDDGKLVAKESIGPESDFVVEKHFDEDTNFLCNGQWHKVKVSYDKDAVSLQIDALPAVNAFADSKQRIGDINVNLISGSLYIGGQDDKINHEKKSQFHGCIRDIVVNGMRKDWTDMRLLNQVSTNACPI